MCEATMTVDELRGRLVRGGHLAFDDESATNTTDVWPTPAIIVTVAMDLDPTLKSAYRNSYFACYLKSKEDPVSAIQDDPAFALPEVARKTAAERPRDDRFLGGPFRWLLQRITRFESVLFWPACPESGQNRAFILTDLLEIVPLVREKAASAASNLNELGAFVLDLRRESDWEILWEIAALVSQDFFDYFISDLDCHEVYQLHHHGKIVASLPDDFSRRELLDDLATWSYLIEDCSCYVSECDEEDENQT